MPQVWEELVAKLKKRKGVKNAYALATEILQKRGILKRGTRELRSRTLKGIDRGK